MIEVKQNTALPDKFYAHDANGDAVTGLVDGGFTKSISKGGGALGSMTVTITEDAKGFYSFTLSASHTDTLGLLTIVFEHASCKQVNLQYRVTLAIKDDIYAYSASAAAWGSINSGIVFRGVVSAAVPGVSFTIGGLAGQGAGAFIDTNTPWHAYVFRDAGGAGAAPQGEQKQITGYTSATGLFTTEAFTAPVAVGDNVIVMSGRIATIPDILTAVNALGVQANLTVEDREITVE